MAKGKRIAIAGISLGGAATTTLIVSFFVPWVRWRRRFDAFDFDLWGMDIQGLGSWFDTHLDGYDGVAYLRIAMATAVLAAVALGFGSLLAGLSMHRHMRAFATPGGWTLLVGGFVALATTVLYTIGADMAMGDQRPYWLAGLSLCLAAGLLGIAGGVLALLGRGADEAQIARLAHTGLELRCPRCGTVTKVPAGRVPVCPSCGKTA